MENVKVWFMFLSLNNINLNCWCELGLEICGLGGFSKCCVTRNVQFISDTSFKVLENTVRISISKNILMGLKIEVQTLTINIFSWVDPLWICMKTKYPKSHKIQSWITLFAFMSPFHLNIVILNNVLLIAKVGVLIMVMFIYVSQI